MPLDVKRIAVRVAVIFFFGVSLVGWASGLSPCGCCKRALAGAAIAYVAGVLVVKAINAILISAIVSNQMNRGKTSGDRD